MSFFAALFVSYLYYRGADVAAFNSSQAELSRTIGLMNTLLLLTSSLFVAKAVQAAGLGQSHVAPRMFLAGLGCALAFVLLKASEYYALLSHGITLETSPFFPFYFGLTALHLAHVLIGSTILGVMAWATRQAPMRHVTLIESGSCFWHMVDLLWIVIFALLYVVR
jgi:nitric oxide reductase NorE protein